MAKTRRTKVNRSPAQAYRNAKTYVVAEGQRVKTHGVRGRTVVVRSIDPKTKKLVRTRSAELHIPAAGGTARPIFVERAYTGVARSKKYPYRSKRQGAPNAPAPTGLLSKAKRAVKRVVVGGDAR